MTLVSSSQYAWLYVLSQAMPHSSIAKAHVTSAFLLAIRDIDRDAMIMYM